ncbi:hypothetical protein FGRMN_1813 [Fusarium graminum]|nr:hypothetical protein FGRMN_1813 [Fusarium graminum]
MHLRLITTLFFALISLGLSTLVVALSKKEGFPNEKLVRFVGDHRTYISIVVQVLSTILAFCQTYVVTSLVNLATNAKLNSSNTPLKLDTLRLLQAMAVKSPIIEYKSKKSLLISVAFVLLLQIPAALWAGSITPTIGNLKKQVPFEVPDFDQSTAKFWASQCAPATTCDELLGETQDLGTFSFVNWKTRTGLLLNSVSQASSRNSSTATYQKLDGTGFVYHGRSYGVGSAVGLLQPIYKDDPKAIIRQYSFLEDGYAASVSCQYNRSSQLSFAKPNMVETPGGLYALQEYWVQGSLPNGEWLGFPTWAVVNEGPTSSIAAVNSQSRYMYGFLAGNSYSLLNQTQCEVSFTVSRFNVSVDMEAKVITVGDSGKNSLDLDPTRALANISFHGVGYLSQTLTTLYTSVLGDSFVRNIDNVQAKRRRMNATDEDIMEAVQDGLNLLLDHFLESTGAAQIMLLQKTKLMDGIGAAVVVVYFKYGLWGKFKLHAESDFLEFKSVILGSFKGSRSNIKQILLD